MRPILPTLFLLAPFASTEVLVVDAANGAGTDFTEIQAAIEAASDGDTLLVRDGAYGGFAVDGKGLVIVAEKGHTPTFGASSVEDLLPGQSVVLRKLTVSGSAASALLVRNSLGPVWVETCDLLAGDVLDPVAPGLPGLSVEESADVTLLRTSCRGGAAGILSIFPFGGGAGAGAGALVVGSDLHAFASTFEGASGEPYSFAGPGLAISDCELWLYGCELVGGDGNDGIVDSQFGESCDECPTDGGAGLRIDGLPAVVRELDSELLGGQAGDACFAWLEGCTALAGAPIQGTPGFLGSLPGTARALKASSPVRDDEDVVFTIDGAPGELAFVAVSTLHDAEWIAPFQSALVSPLASLTILSAGAVPGSGQVAFAVPAPNVSSSLEALTFYAQSVLIDLGQASAHVGGASEVTLLDAQF